MSSLSPEMATRRSFTSRKTSESQNPVSNSGQNVRTGERGWFATVVRASQEADPAFPRVTLHDLRPTAASLAISASASVKAVPRHALATTTPDTYADLFEGALEAVAVPPGVARTGQSVGFSRGLGDCEAPQRAQLKWNSGGVGGEQLVRKEGLEPSRRSTGS